ncbi:helix-turn-helix domain-containing protein [Leptolyngbya sp. FACHB-17]|uniref:helix-turn-helix domain-containing protein n=1 Tax=unclassified Leptolyngbya TaxID=2650499 RepID=UPI00168020BC|nr:helix-turn-helix domain-containing protein [Leptolyngbya sp. FACHB-17]MBD2079600.1 helix-turn-helix domain-containing protein [Leptolyngbya sp. FACHB-17]
MTHTWLTLAETCDRANVSESTIERWIKNGHLRSGIHYGGSGRLRRFDAEMMDAAIRFQDDPQAHEQVIALKRKLLFGRKAV